MVRSAAALVAVLILPGFVVAQEPQGTHTVVDHDTLWDLAQRYYSNPFEWRVIWEANREVVEDPNLIYPAEMLVIPGLPGDEIPVEGPTTCDPFTPFEDPNASLRLACLMASDWDGRSPLAAFGGLRLAGAFPTLGNSGWAAPRCSRNRRPSTCSTPVDLDQSSFKDCSRALG